MLDIRKKLTESFDQRVDDKLAAKLLKELAKNVKHGEVIPFGRLLFMAGDGKVSGVLFAWNNRLARVNLGLRSVSLWRNPVLDSAGNFTTPDYDLILKNDDVTADAIIDAMRKTTPETTENIQVSDGTAGNTAYDPPAIFAEAVDLSEDIEYFLKLGNALIVSDDHDGKADDEIHRMLVDKNLDFNVVTQGATASRLYERLSENNGDIFFVYEPKESGKEMLKLLMQDSNYPVELKRPDNSNESLPETIGFNGKIIVVTSKSKEEMKHYYPDSPIISAEEEINDLKINERIAKKMTVPTDPDEALRLKVAKALGVGEGDVSGRLFLVAAALTNSAVQDGADEDVVIRKLKQITARQ